VNCLCSRRADVLKVWVALQRYGADGMGALFDHLCEHPEEIPQSIPDGELATRVTDHLAGMTDRFSIAQFEALTVPAAF